MTAPVTAPASLVQLAGWDVAGLRSGVARLGEAADRLRPWRDRLDVLGRRLGTAECWSGPAGRAAAAAVVELSTEASGAAGAMGTSLTSLRGLSGAAAEAQEWAAGALATAASVGVVLDDAGGAHGLPAAPGPATAADQRADVLAVQRGAQLAGARAAEARAAAARALACAREAQLPLLHAGAAPGQPAGPTALRPAPVPPPLPRRRDPQRAADWWSGLTAAAQLAEIAARPALVGALDGLPAWARDRANRLVLAAALAPGGPAGEQRQLAGVVAGQLAAQERAGTPVQLLQFAPAAGLVAVALGDLDAAGAVGVLVPGILTTPDDDLPAVLDDAAAVGRAAEAAAPGLAVATVAWLGYRTPGLATAALTRASRRGGPALDRALDGLAAARATATTVPAPRTTVVAHSYGTVVTGQAVRAPGPLAADALVLLGSPGLAGGGAERLEAAEVHGAASPADPVSWLGWFGGSPTDMSYGDSPLPTALTQGHTGYLDADHPTLAAIGEVVAGVRDGG
ncbi:alpha/beta hydrolase [Modestobacter versicolor]|uniref:alpha/beta hydrolase n=1 Tax=Modestobacter versicolor TaxID=429133 RepID=UPI0034DFF49E